MKAELGKTYRHYKNEKLYRVVAIARHSETMEEMIVYEGQYTDQEFGDKPVWVRPREMFEEKVHYHDEEIDRFTLIA